MHYTVTDNCENYADDVIEALQLYCETGRLSLLPFLTTCNCSKVLFYISNKSLLRCDSICGMTCVCVCVERANHGGICRLGAIMLRLGELARATEAHQRCVVMIANDPGHYGNLPFPQLFQEVHLNHLMETGDIKPVSPAAVTQPAST